MKPTHLGEASIGIRQKIWVSFNITVPKGAMTEVTVKLQGAKTDKVGTEYDLDTLMNLVFSKSFK